MLAGMLDKRADGIRTDLDEARGLREEAQALLASYERKQREVQDQADRIVAQARAEAEAAAEQAKADLRQSIDRRLAAAEDQIASAEAAAVREVRDRAVQRRHRRRARSDRRTDDRGPCGPADRRIHRGRRRQAALIADKTFRRIRRIPSGPFAFGRSGQSYMRSPKMAEPTRTWVAPKEIAASKSPLIPIDSPSSPLRPAILREQGEMQGRRFVDRRDAHQPAHRQVERRGIRR